MKDFSEWLDELTGELQESEEAVPGMWQDAEGTIPVTREGQPVGRVDHVIAPWYEDTFDGGTFGLFADAEPKAEGPGYITKPMAIRTVHDLFRTGDPDAPDAPDCIKDSRNNDVVLGMCRICGKAEVELSEPCIVLGKNMTATEVMNMREQMEMHQRKQALHDRLMQSTTLLDYYWRNAYKWREEDENE